MYKEKLRRRSDLKKKQIQGLKKNPTRKAYTRSNRVIDLPSPKISKKNMEGQVYNDARIKIFISQIKNTIKFLLALD